MMMSYTLYTLDPLLLGLIFYLSSDHLQLFTLFMKRGIEDDPILNEVY